MGKVQLAQAEGATQKAGRIREPQQVGFRHTLFKRVLIALLGNTDHSVVFIISSAAQGGRSIGWFNRLFAIAIEEHVYDLSRR